MAVFGLSVEQGVVNTWDGTVTVITRANYLTGTVTGPVPPGTQLWVVTTPEAGKLYVQGDGPVEPDADGRFNARFNIGKNDDSVSETPNQVRVVQVAEATGAYLASCHPNAEANPLLAGPLPWHEAGRISVLKVVP